MRAIRETTRCSRNLDKLATTSCIAPPCIFVRTPTSKRRSWQRLRARPIPCEMLCACQSGSLRRGVLIADVGGRRCSKGGISRGRKLVPLPRCKALRRTAPAHPLLQTLLRWPYHGNLRKTISEELDRTQRGLKALDQEAKRRASEDIDLCRRTAAPLSKYSDVWTFPVCLITYSTMTMAWASELAGAR